MSNSLFNLLKTHNVPQRLLPINITSPSEIHLPIPPYPIPEYPRISISTFFGKLFEKSKYLSNEAKPLEINPKAIMDFAINSPKMFKQCISKYTTHYIKKIQHQKDIFNLDENNITTSPKEGFPHGCSFKIQPVASKKRTIDCKLFKIGKIQMTGCKSWEELNTISSILITLIWHLFGVDVELKNTKIAMIKSNFNTYFKIDLDALVHVIDDEYSDIIQRTHDSLYVGARFYWIAPFCSIHNGKQQKVTFIVNSSGNIAIMCNKDYNNVEVCWKFINKILKKHYNQIVYI